MKAGGSRGICRTIQGLALSLAALCAFFAACRRAQPSGARQAFLSYHEAVFHLDARAARRHMSADLTRRFDQWLDRTAVLSDDMKMKILLAGLPYRPQLRGVSVRRDEALLTMTGETVGGQKVTGRVTMIRDNGDWRVQSLQCDVAGDVISL